jgi:hypothetical protein
MAIVLRSVKGSNLTPNEVDGNFTDLDGRVNDLEAATASGLAIDLDDPIDVVGTDFYLNMNDATQRGPYPLPVVVPNPRGEWTPATSYSTHDWVHYQGATYAVLFNHTSAGSFDPNAESGGYDLYELVVPAPEVNVPATVSTSASSLSHPLSHTNKYVRATNGGGLVLTIEPDATINHPVDSEATYVARGGAITVIAGAGVTLNVPDGFLSQTSAQGAWIILKKYAANAWDMTGGPLAVDPSA